MFEAFKDKGKSLGITQIPRLFSWFEGEGLKPTLCCGARKNLHVRGGAIGFILIN